MLGNTRLKEADGSMLIEMKGAVLIKEIGDQCHRLFKFDNLRG